MSVIIRKIRTALNREYQKAGGIQIQVAIDQAHENLGGLEEQSLARIDEAIDLIAEMTADPARRPTDKELRKIHALVNEMLGYCVAINVPGLTDTLYATARLVAGLLATDAWLDGTLTPAVNLLRLVRRGVVGPDDLQVLIVGIDQCVERISRPSPLAAGT